MDGVAYVSSQDGNLYAFDAATGSLLWTGDTGYSDSSPAVADGRVHVGTASGLITFPASCSTPCAPLWTADTQTTINPAVTWSEGKVYASAYSGYLDAFDAPSGDLLWSGLVNAIDPVFGPSAVSRGIVYVPGDKGLYAFRTNCTTPCEPLWIFRTPYGLEKSPSIVAGVAYVTGDQGNALRAGRADGRADVGGGGVRDSHLDRGGGGQGVRVGGGWEAAGVPQIVRGQPLPSGLDRALPRPRPVRSGGGERRRVRGLDRFLLPVRDDLRVPQGLLHLCRPLWSYAVDGAIEQPPTVADGILYVGTLTGKVYAFGIAATDRSP